MLVLPFQVLRLSAAFLTAMVILAFLLTVIEFCALALAFFVGFLCFGFV